MPRGNGTGPGVKRPMRGRGVSHSAGNMNAAGGRGHGSCGRHGGGGRRNRFRANSLTGWQQAATGQAASDTPEPVAPTATKEQEVDALKGQAEHLQDVLEGINQQIEELESQASEKVKE